MNDLRQCRENQIIQTSKQWKENLNWPLSCQVSLVFNYSAKASHKIKAIIVITGRLRHLSLLRVSIDNNNNVQTTWVYVENVNITKKKYKFS